MLPHVPRRGPRRRGPSRHGHILCLDLGESIVLLANSVLINSGYHSSSHYVMWLFFELLISRFIKYVSFFLKNN